MSKVLLGDFDVSIFPGKVDEIRQTVKVFLDGLKDHGPIYDHEVVPIEGMPGCFDVYYAPPPMLSCTFTLSPETTGKMPAGTKMSRRSRRRWRGKGRDWNDLFRSLL